MYGVQVRNGKNVRVVSSGVNKVFGNVVIVGVDEGRVDFLGLFKEVFEQPRLVFEILRAKVKLGDFFLLPLALDLFKVALRELVGHFGAELVQDHLERLLVLLEVLCLGLHLPHSRFILPQNPPLVFRRLFLPFLQQLLVARERLVLVLQHFILPLERRALLLVVFVH